MRLLAEKWLGLAAVLTATGVSGCTVEPATSGLGTSSSSSSTTSATSSSSGSAGSRATSTSSGAAGSAAAGSGGSGGASGGGGSGGVGASGGSGGASGGSGGASGGSGGASGGSGGGASGGSGGASGGSGGGASGGSGGGASGGSGGGASGGSGGGAGGGSGGSSAGGGSVDGGGGSGGGSGGGASGGAGGGMSDSGTGDVSVDASDGAVAACFADDADGGTPTPPCSTLGYYAQRCTDDASVQSAPLGAVICDDLDQDLKDAAFQELFDCLKAIPGADGGDACTAQHDAAASDCSQKIFGRSTCSVQDSNVDGGAYGCAQIVASCPSDGGTGGITMAECQAWLNPFNAVARQGIIECYLDPGVIGGTSCADKFENECVFPSP